MDTLGDRVRFLRKKYKIKQKKLSDETGVCRSNISKIENNEINPTANSVIAIARYFQVSTDWLLLGREQYFCDTGLAGGDEGCTVAEGCESYQSEQQNTAEAVISMLERLEKDKLERVADFIRFEISQQIRGK